MSDVVSLTPASLNRDSRTLKEATTIARLSHRSTVVQAIGSPTTFADAPFTVLTLRSLGESLADDHSGGAGTPNPSRSLVDRVAGIAGRVAGPLYFLASWTAFNLSTARGLPRADLYWLHGYEQALAVWLKRTPYVYDAHDLYAALPFDGRPLRRSERWTHRVRLTIERACARRAAVRVTTSATMARACEQMLGAPFVVVRNAQDPRLARPSASDVRTAAGAGPDDFLLVMVAQRKPGTVIPQALPDGVRLAFVGDGYEDEAVRPGVSFVGSVPHDELAAYIATADAAALLYVPVNANSPAQLVNGLFHAVAAGLPLLLPAHMDAIRELGEKHGLGVVVDPADPASVAAGIAALRADQEALRESVARAAPALTWEREEEAVAAVLAQAGVGSPAPSPLA
jgi:glycosyltransferase involved in cell wall biosynthesis